MVLNSLPKSALAPLLIVWLGANERTIVVAGMSVAIFGSVINENLTDEVIVTVIATGFDKKAQPLYNNVQNTTRRPIKEAEVMASEDSAEVPAESETSTAADSEFEIPPFLRNRNY